ncbi:TIGR00341 family protein [Agromyces sp. Marseille-Q5079]|uniref:TIGR00341 family protein n=1 Tax=Agromyces sp. Marseille-Q5079 TaxID=3439059 RepID=UPI003D9C8E2A
MSETARPGPQLNDLAHMRDAVLFDGPQAPHKLSRFWMLLILSSIIAAAGVVADSTATVIGAMIVAPLMLPIQGTMLATVLGDRDALIRSLLLLVAGAATAVGIGFAVGLMVVNEVVASNNSQVASRVSPGLIDLLAALATGVVGSIALVRRDISDTLPGVAIAISLVPPLSVVGLTLQSGAPDQSLGALLLFLTNVAAIIGTGIVVMAVYGASRLAAPPSDARQIAHKRRNTAIALTLMGIVVIVPLTITSVQTAENVTREATVHGVADTWGSDVGWTLTTVTTSNGIVVAKFEGDGGEPDTAALESALRDAGIDPSDVQVELIPTYTVKLGPAADSGNG